MTLPYWEYFLAIEADLIDCVRYVEFSEENYSTYSIEFARIIMAACSEIDTVAKEICKIIEPEKKPKKINKYCGIIKPRFQKLTETIVEIPRYHLSFTPWETWTEKKSPAWWGKGYNDIKHDRTKNFSEANLENALFSTAGLLVAILYYYEAAYGKKNRPRISAFNAPKLFTVKGAEYVIEVAGDYFWDYELPK